MSGSADYELTPNLGLYKPNYNLDVDEWGNHLNDNADILDLAITDMQNNYLPLSGSQQMTGTLLTIAGTGGSNLGIGIGNNTTGLWSSGGNALVLQTGGSANLYLSPTGNQMAQPLTMMGALTLSGAPTADLQAATKKYVDDAGGNYLPLAGGTLSGGLHFGSTAASSTTDLSRHLDLYGGTFGLNVTSSRFNHVAPAGSSHYFVAGGTDVLQMTQTAISAKVGLNFGSTLATALDLSRHIALFGADYGLNVINGRMQLIAGGVASLQIRSASVDATVPVTLPADPTTALQAVTKQYVDARVGGITDAPSDGTAYGRLNAAWAGVLPLAGGTLVGPLLLAADPTAALGASTKQYTDAGVAAAVTAAGVVSGRNTGRNMIHNPLFNVQQRGTTAITTNAYSGADRWAVNVSLDTVSVFPTAAGDSARAQVGDEAMTNFLRNNFTGSASAAAYNALYQRIENVRKFGGKTVIVSFYAQASAALNLGVSFTQIFGSGGSPTTPNNLNGQSVLLSTVWQRYSVAVAIPSCAGKTLGTNGDDSLQLNLWFSAAANNATIAGNPGVQSGTVSLWGIQVEIAQAGQTAPSALEKPDAADDWKRCTRFFRWLKNCVIYMTAAGANQAQVVDYPYERMRGNPTVTFQPSYTNAQNIQVNGTNNFPDHCAVQYASIAAGSAFVIFDMLLSADL